MWYYCMLACPNGTSDASALRQNVFNKVKILSVNNENVKSALSCSILVMLSVTVSHISGNDVLCTVYDYVLISY